MKSAITPLIASFAILVLALFFGVSTGHAATITVGPTGQYPDPCSAFKAGADGDTFLIDANNGIPYNSICTLTLNYVTVVGVNGRPIMDPGTQKVYLALWTIQGHDDVIDNIELRNTANVGGGDFTPGIIVTPKESTPSGGNLTIEQCYFFNNKMGIQSGNVGAAPYQNYSWYSANPYITLQYDEFAYSTHELNDLAHNIYLGYGGNMTFNLYYSYTHDNNGGHELKSRAEHNNIYYNWIADFQGNSDFIIDFPLGGDTYVVGNVLYKANTNGNTNVAFMTYRDQADNKDSGVYPAPNDDLHFVNNTVIDGANNQGAGLLAYVNMGCYDDGLTTDQCPLPQYGGGPLTTPAVFENNIFVGPSSLEISNQTGPTHYAYLKNNIVETNTPANLAALFVDPANRDFHLASSSPAIQAGIWPPTDNQGNADPLVEATEENVDPVSNVARPTPSGNTMDAGAYSYPRVDNPPTLQLSYSNTVTAPETGTITISGLPGNPSRQSTPAPLPPAGQTQYATNPPAAGQFTNVEFVSGNTSVIPNIDTAVASSGSVTVTFQTNPITSTTTVPIDIYADGAHAQATVTVEPGPPVLYSVTQQQNYWATDIVNLEGPAPAGGLVVNLSSSDPTYLYTPATVTVPAGQISATIGTLAAQFFTNKNNPPNTIPETETASAGGVTKTLTQLVYSPGWTGIDCGNCTVVGGQSLPFGSYISSGPVPETGGDVTITSSNTAVIPNQTAVHVNAGAINFPSNNSPEGQGFNVTTNAVTQSTSVTVTAYFGPNAHATTTVTVNPSSPGGPASIATVSGSGQSANIGTNFANPLVVLVEDANSNPVSGATVTFAGTGVSFPNGATAVTGSNGEASVVAQPTQSGSLTVNATVTGVSTPATFSETGTAGGVLGSITSDSTQVYHPQTSVNLAAAATSPVTVQLSSSDSTVAYVPATITIPTGQTSAETGSLVGSLWGQSPLTKSATLSATYNGNTVTLTRSFQTLGISAWGCNSCTVTGGSPEAFILDFLGFTPYGGATIQITSNNPSVVPNQSFPYAAGVSAGRPLVQTNTVTASTPVSVTVSVNGANRTRTLTVSP